jgi:hypothetical protein
MKIYLTLPIFLDVHSIGTTTEDDLIKSQNAQRDELGVKVVNILYNLEGGVIYCLLDAPNKEAVEKHHGKIDVKSDLIMEVKTTQKTWEARASNVMYYKYSAVLQASEHRSDRSSIR